MLPRFDIFSGNPDKDAVWVESIKGLADAVDRMQQIATKTPGLYFLFCPGTHTIVAHACTLTRTQLQPEVRDEIA